MFTVLLFQYLKWHFIVAPREIFRGWGNILWFGFNYFSAPLLLKTLFAPWHRIAWSYGRGFDILRFLSVLSSNLISRVLGAIMRSVLIIAGIIAEIALFVLGVCIFIIWFMLPAFIVVGFFYGLILLI